MIYYTAHICIYVEAIIYTNAWACRCNNKTNEWTSNKPNKQIANIEYIYTHSPHDSTFKQARQYTDKYILYNIHAYILHRDYMTHTRWFMKVSPTPTPTSDGLKDTNDPWHITLKIYTHSRNSIFQLQQDNRIRAIIWFPVHFQYTLEHMNMIKLTHAKSNH